MVFRDFPLTHIHAQAFAAARAARCAGEQKRYWEYHDILFSKTKALDLKDLKQYSADLNLNTAEFNQCLNGGSYADGVREDLAIGARVGVTGTPAFFINGRFLSGAQSYATFAEVIEESLAAQLSSEGNN